MADVQKIFPEQFGASFFERLQGDAVNLGTVLEKVQQALRIRSKIIERMDLIISELKSNLQKEKFPDFPGMGLVSVNKRLNQSLVMALEKEEKFIEIVKRGSKLALATLKKTLKLIEKSDLPSEEKIRIEEIILNLIESMRFIKINMRHIGDRVKYGKKMAEKNYGEENGNIFYSRVLVQSFVDTFDEERQLDERLAKKLRGELRKVYTPLNRFLQICKQGLYGEIAAAAAVVAMNTYLYSQERIASILLDKPIRPFLEYVKEPGSLLVFVAGSAVCITLAILAGSDDSVLREGEIERKLLSN